LSIQAVSWAFNQDIAQSSEKFVLIALCNYADTLGICYPSIARLAFDTGLDRKTVMDRIASLESNGIIRDTKKRVGPTRRVTVYKIIGLAEASTVHYVYKLTHMDTGQFYIGKRSFDGDPEKDVYRGSGKWPKLMMMREVPLHREIIRVFSTAEEAASFEIQTIREAEGNDLCMNGDLPRLKKILAKGGEYNPENGTIKNQIVPFPSTNSPVFSGKQSQKRDSYPLSDPPYKHQKAKTIKKELSEKELQDKKRQLDALIQKLNG
jgi:DNA-binding Lrp family transcriptional regulator